ncbi:protein of unknown function (plasmid) [Azospirillum baldaniorum]|uniref:Uncharacterized protein n=1 Tax=Azospirillum baldaniorum TaxID=1064539 RepID=A0A9P1JXS6_9PROT|nr:protein of unknown function [Azospirillum baldaniorum]
MPFNVTCKLPRRGLPQHNHRTTLLAKSPTPRSARLSGASETGALQLPLRRPANAIP